MYEELLKECGLTQNESLVYLALLKIGKSKIGEIVKEAGISGGKIYETLYKLIDKGIVKFISENNVKYFIANEPETLISYIKEREKVLHEKEEILVKVIPELKSLRKKDDKLDMVSLIKGLKGIFSLVDNGLENAKNIKVMGVRSSKNVQYNNFWRNWHRKRVQLKKKAQILFSDKNTEYWNFFKELKYTEVKEIDNFTPSAVMIIDDNVFIFSYEEEFTCINITSEPITTSFSEFFNDLWKIAKK